MAALIGALLLIISFGIIVQFRRNGITPIQSTQRFFWRIDLIVNQIKIWVNSRVPKITEPFIWVQSRVAYLSSLFFSLRRMLKRS